MGKGTIAIEEAVLNPDGLAWIGDSAALFNPGQGQNTPSAPGPASKHGLTQALLDIHDARLAQMDAHGVEYMLLSLTSPGAQGEPDPVKAQSIARGANDWLAEQVALNPRRFGAFASVSMHDAQEAAAEARRAVKELGMFGVMLNDYQSTTTGSGKKYYDAPDYRPFWKEIEGLNVPVYMHPRYPPAEDLQPGTRYGDRKQILGAAVQFHLDLSMHLYGLCSSGVFDAYPGVQVVAGHLGEGIPFNLWRADHWYNKPVKKATRPSRHDYSHYFKHNISITTSGDFNTQGLKFCIGEIGVERCLFSIDYPYDSIEEAQNWWKGVDLPEEQKEAVARRNAIRLFKLPLEP
ncbi:hypothetical protein QBC46DRAFT_440145 [Diplogelasinospora grovesii]|uniref:Amidohydrolase-related domain-containing protein n=1 Tax=Diplogelasinospora grovesii TaxID=303347 RepID=A0AAN6N3K6_9PEZI|nr:hypothetical protein QBC46DRAFT_440145 [Diplogelasinospora grovesii]